MSYPTPENTKNKIWGHLSPYPGQNYPTQYAGNMKGGYRSVANTTAMYDLPVSHRKHGMKVYCISNNITYRLQSNLTSWVTVDVGGNATITSPYTKYEYNPVGDYDKVTCLKWYDGRLEYFLRTREKIIENRTDRFFYTYRTPFYFSNHQRFNAEPIAVVCGLSSNRSNADEISWGVLHDDITASVMDVECFARDYQTHARQTVHVVGRWK